MSIDIVGLARDLIGKEIHTKINGGYCAGIITETEAYAGQIDKASHAFGGRRTNRTSTMYKAGGISYVYLCYGIHHLFNVVTGPEEVPHAVLVRGIKPLKGISLMEKRRNNKSNLKNFSNGPGTLTSALGIKIKNNDTDLNSNVIWLEDNGIKVRETNVFCGPRIGVNYAGKDAILPYRFLWKP